MTPGIYRTTREVMPLRKDRRRSDWQYCVIRAGTLFAIRDAAEELSGAGSYVREALYVTLLRGYAHHRVWLRDAEAAPLLSALKRVEEPRVADWFHFIERPNVGDRLLQYLVDTGQMSMAEVRLHLLAMDARNLPKEEA